MRVILAVTRNPPTSGGLSTKVARVTLRPSLGSPVPPPPPPGAGVWNACVPDHGPVVVGSNARTRQNSCAPAGRSDVASTLVCPDCSPTVNTAIRLTKALLSATSAVYDTLPIGPDRCAFANVNFGRNDDVTAFAIGEMGVGGWMTIGVYTFK